MVSDSKNQCCPTSSTHIATALAGLSSFLIGLSILKHFLPFDHNLVKSAFFLIVLTAAGIFLVDLAWQKIYRSPSTGIDFSVDNPSWQRSMIKFAGLLASLGFIGLFYWLFPEYAGSFYFNFFNLLTFLLPLWLLLALPYFYFIDRHMPEPHDGFWQMGNLALLRWQHVDYRILGQHLLGWLIKGFFLPLMFTYMCNDLGKFLNVDFTSQHFYRFWYDSLYDFLYFIDVSLVSMGYLMSFRLTDTHLRTAEPTMLGWTVALVCYEPFWSLFGRNYLAYNSGFQWGAWLSGAPMLSITWSVILLVLTGIYVWATVVFGARFSNLSHRGIITNGPYRWTKHPAYIAKNMSWWMISIPFIYQGSFTDTSRHCLLLIGLNCIYLLRAKTEERHLSHDPIYVNYAEWISENGLFRFMNKLSLSRQ